MARPASPATGCWAGSLLALEPEVRVATLVTHSEHQGTLHLGAVDDEERERPHQKLPCPSPQRSTKLRILLQVRERPLDLGEELYAQTLRLSLVKPCSPAKIRLGGAQQDKRCHGWSSERSWASTSAAGTISSSPAK
jgi:hypothetical protein